VNLFLAAANTFYSDLIDISGRGGRDVCTTTRMPAVTTSTNTRLDADPFRLTMLIFAIIAFMYFTGEVLKPLALSILLSFALAPAARLLERCGLPRVAAVVLTVVVTLGFLGGIGWVVGQQLTSLAKGLPDYKD
jgi:predicted PurR-regulated permease PerM